MHSNRLVYHRVALCRERGVVGHSVSIYRSGIGEVCHSFQCFSSGPVVSIVIWTVLLTLRMKLLGSFMPQAT